MNQLMFTTTLSGGVLRYEDSPLLRAIIHGRVIVIDEADKAPAHVVAAFHSLGAHGEMTLADGRRVRRVKEREEDIVVHRNFRIILLANRPGYRESRIWANVCFVLEEADSLRKRSWAIISCKCWVTASVGECY